LTQVGKRDGIVRKSKLTLDGGSGLAVLEDGTLPGDIEENLVTHDCG
jgi:hypothetical protein